MSDLKLAESPSGALPASKEGKREVAQQTLSAIGDVSLAVSEGVAQVDAVPQRIRWRPILVFSLAVYASSVGLVWLLEKSPPWLLMLVAPLWPALCATVAFGWRQTWKFRAKDSRLKLKVWEDALDSVGYEVVNAANAMRANLIGFRLANPQVNYPQHLDVIEEGIVRIGAIVEKAQDPVAWHAEKKKKKKTEGATPGSVAEDTRSRIAL